MQNAISPNLQTKEHSMYTDFITKTLLEASAIARSNFGQAQELQTKEGDANQALTETDIAVGQLIINRVAKYYPDHNIIDEEAGVIDKASDYTWVIDPIDGTSNFARGLPQYGIMIGLLYNGHPIAGGVSLPEFDEIYTASKGAGAYCNSQPIHVTTRDKLIDNLVAYNIDGNHARPEITRQEVKIVAEILVNIRNVRNAGSVYDLAALATGKYGGWLTKSSKIWDVVAPHIIAEEAGALVTGFDGSAIDYSQPISKAADTFTWCMAPAPLHNQLQKIIHSV